MSTFAMSIRQKPVFVVPEVESLADLFATKLFLIFILMVGILKPSLKYLIPKVLPFIPLKILGAALTIDSISIQLSYYLGEGAICFLYYLVTGDRICFN